jgi:hypothetical protein
MTLMDQLISMSSNKNMDIYHLSDTNKIYMKICLNLETTNNEGRSGPSEKCNTTPFESYT